MYFPLGKTSVVELNILHISVFMWKQFCESVILIFLRLCAWRYSLLEIAHQPPSPKLFCTWCSCTHITQWALIAIQKYRRIWWFLHYEEIRFQQRISSSKTPKIHGGWANEIPRLLLSHPISIPNVWCSSYHVRICTSSPQRWRMLLKQSSVHFSPIHNYLLLLGKKHQ